MPRYRATAVLTWEFEPCGSIESAQALLEDRLMFIELDQTEEYKGYRDTTIEEMETDDNATKQ